MNYWSLENLFDSIGGANLTAGSQYFGTYDRFNRSNSAMFFNQGYLQVPKNIYFSGDFTLIVWLKLNSSALSIPMIDFGDVGMQINSLSINAFTGPNNLLKSVTKLALNEWYHVAFVLKNITGFIYINGKLDKSDNSQTVPTSKQRTTNYIGKSNQAVDLAYAIYDDIMLYSGAMNSLQISNHYEYSQPGLFYFELETCCLLKNLNNCLSYKLILQINGTCPL